MCDDFSALAIDNSNAQNMKLSHLSARLTVMQDTAVENVLLKMFAELTLNPKCSSKWPVMASVLSLGTVVRLCHCQALIYRI